MPPEITRGADCAGSESGDLEAINEGGLRYHFAWVSTRPEMSVEERKTGARTR